MPESGDVDQQREQLLLQALQAVASVTSGPDPYMAGHSSRVSDYCGRIAESMGLPDRARLVLHVAASFHDIGNLSTPAYVLRKPSILGEDEMEEVRVHPIKGAQVFAGTPELAEIGRAIRHHHERFDGTGYPDGLSGDAIPLFSRIILVAETYEAMTHDRPYRRAIPHDEAMRRIEASAGTQLDPTIVAHLVAVMSKNGAA